MTVHDWRDAVAKREARKVELKEERALVVPDSVMGRKLKAEDRENNRMLKDNRRHLAIAESVAARKRATRFMGV